MTLTPDRQTSLERVKAALAEAGSQWQVVTLPDSTHSAADAAKAIGCEVAQIAKSIVFRAKETNHPVLVIASGINRVDEKRVAEILGEKIEKADADFIRDRTGFAIGGVSPVGHTGPVITILDEDLWKYDSIWAAAGTPYSVFKTSAEQLLSLTAGKRATIARVA